MKEKKPLIFWFIPLLILGLGALPSVRESFWWEALGALLFVIFIVIYGWSWLDAVQEQRKLFKEAEQATIQENSTNTGPYRKSS
ncbi:MULTISPECIES: hypothetical protein [unclassified Paenibacillus]|uniref:hypothetical protein n=1 Tax=unclassified Paenibacillus TaxID=185978 RepID=UPI00363F096C